MEALVGVRKGESLDKFHRILSKASAKLAGPTHPSSKLEKYLHSRGRVGSFKFFITVPILGMSWIESKSLYMQMSLHMCLRLNWSDLSVFNSIF